MEVNQNFLEAIMNKSLLLISFFMIAASSCSKPNSSSVKIDNGTRVFKEDQDTIPAVTQIFSSQPGADMGSACTATFVSDNTLLTSSHCVVDANTNELLIVSINGALTSQEAVKIKATAVYKAPGFKFGAIQTNQGVINSITSPKANDIAVAVFPDKTFKHYFEVSGAAVAKDGQVLMVGLSKFLNYKEVNPAIADGRGAKQWGKNIVSSIDPVDGFQTLTTFGAGVSQGDSGGPLLDNCKVVGTASARGGVNSIHSAVAYNLDFLKSLESKGAYFCGLSGFDPAHCGDGKAVPSSNTDKTSDGRLIFPCNSNGIVASGNSAPDAPAPNNKVPVIANSDIKIKLHETSLGENPMAFLSTPKETSYVEICESTTVEDCMSANSSYRKVTKGFDSNGRRILYDKMNIVKSDTNKSFVLIARDSQDALIVSRVFSLKSN